MSSKRSRKFLSIALLTGFLLMFTFSLSSVNAQTYAITTENLNSSAAPPPNFKFEQYFPVDLGDPEGIAINSTGHIFVVINGLGGVQIFDKAGTMVDSFSSTELETPKDIAINSTGHIFISDYDDDRIEIFDSYYNWVGFIGSSGNASAQFNDPHGLSINGTDSIYVVDSMNHRIQVFDSNGNFIRKWGQQGTFIPSVDPQLGNFSYPSGIDCDNQGKVYVADKVNDRIQVFDDCGNYLDSFGQNGDNDGEFINAWDVDVGPMGTIFCSDWENHRVQMFYYNNYMHHDNIGQNDTDGDDDYLFRSPEYIATQIVGNELLVVVNDDYINHKIKVYNETLSDLGLSVTPHADINYTEGEEFLPSTTPKITWTIYSAPLPVNPTYTVYFDNTPITSLVDQFWIHAQSFDVAVNTNLAAGTYEYRIEVADGRGNSASDTVIVTVVPQNNNNAVLIAGGIGGAVIIVGVVVSVAKKRSWMRCP